MFNNYGVMMLTRIRASAVVVHAGKLLVVRLEDPHTKVTQLFVPGGKIEDGESAAAAAIRETFEETGVRIQLSNPIPFKTTYPFRWNDVVYQCTTSFFAAGCNDSSIPGINDDAPYNKGAFWLNLHEVEKAIGFDQQISAAVTTVIKKYFP